MPQRFPTPSHCFSLVYRIPPFYYLHVLDQNSNVTRLEVGPKTFVKQDHEKVILGPERMLIIPYVLIWNSLGAHSTSVALCV